MAVRAHVGRLLAYALPVESESAAQRALIEEALAWRTLPAEHRGQAPDLAGLGRRWAVDEAYPEKMAGVGNDILGS